MKFEVWECLQTLTQTENELSSSGWLSSVWRFDSHCRHSKKIDETDSWRGVSPPPCQKDVWGALEPGTVPPCSPGAVIGCPPLQCICPYECVSLCMCMCVFNRCQLGWVKSGGQILCISCTWQINLILILILIFTPSSFQIWTNLLVKTGNWKLHRNCIL